MAAFSKARQAFKSPNARNSKVFLYSLHLLCVWQKNLFQQLLLVKLFIIVTCKQYSIIIIIFFFCKSKILSAVRLVESVQQAALAPACTRRPFPSKWCRAQHTVPHQAAYPGPGPAAQHRRLFMKAVMNCVIPSCPFVARLCVHTGVFLCLTVCARGGEGGLQAASYYGLWWSVVLSSQWQLTHYCEVSQRFVRIESIPCSCYKKCVMRYNFSWCAHYYYVGNRTAYPTLSCCCNHVVSRPVTYCTILLVIVPLAPASWPPAADCCSSLLQLGQQQEELQRGPAVPPALGESLASAPATFPVHWGAPASQGSRHGPWTGTSVPAEELLSYQLLLHQLCRITLLRTHSHQVILLSTWWKWGERGTYYCKWIKRYLVVVHESYSCLFLQLMMATL